MSMSPLLLRLVLACLTFRITFGHPDGADPMSCQLMLPGHLRRVGARISIPIGPQKTMSPYTIMAGWDEEHRQYIRVSVTGMPLKGFLIQARKRKDGPAVGEFKLFSNESARYQDCTGDKFKFNPHASITHKSTATKSNLFVLWTPSGQKGNVTFYGTILQDYNTFWLAVPSNEIDLSTMPDVTRPPSSTMPDVTRPPSSGGPSIFDLIVPTLLPLVIVFHLFGLTSL